MQINFHSRLCSYLPRVPIFLAMTVFAFKNTKLEFIGKI